MNPRACSRPSLISCQVKPLLGCPAAVRGGILTPGTTQLEDMAVDLRRECQEPAAGCSVALGRSQELPVGDLALSAHRFPCPATWRGRGGDDVDAAEHGQLLGQASE